jgi:SWI/SNF-related matrix-associated actin-dependent regulator of chromatin subfamily A3
MSEADAKLKTNVPIAEGSYIFKMQKDDDSLFLVFPDGKKLGHFNTHLAKHLGPLMTNSFVQFDAITNADTLRELMGRMTKANDAVVRININVYGTREYLKEIGDDLSKSKLYLQRPDQFRPGVPYENPHYLQFPALEINIANNIEELQNQDGIPSSNVNKDKDGVANFKKAVTDVYASLTRGSHLKRVDGNFRIKTPLLP